jgi:hypothetical protein
MDRLFGVSSLRETRFVSLRAVTYTIRDAKSFGSQIVSQFSRRPQRSFKGHWVQMFIKLRH